MDLSVYSLFGQEIRREMQNDATITDVRLADYVMRLSGSLDCLAIDAEREIEALREELRTLRGSAVDPS